MTALPAIEALEEEARRLVLPRFDESDALALGEILLRLAIDGRHPVVIDIRTANRTLFHAALPGSGPINDLWARRKSTAALLWQEPSLLVGRRMAERGEALERHGLSEADCAVHGGAVPVRVAGVGVVAVATVSGLPQLEDHRMVVTALETLAARMAGAG